MDQNAHVPNKLILGFPTSESSRICTIKIKFAQLRIATRSCVSLFDISWTWALLFTLSQTRMHDMTSTVHESAKGSSAYGKRYLFLFTNMKKTNCLHKITHPHLIHEHVFLRFFSLHCIILRIYIDVARWIVFPSFWASITALADPNQLENWKCVICLYVIVAKA